MKHKIQIFVYLLLISSASIGQSTYYGLGLGTAFYWGDLNTPGFIENVFNNNGLAVQGFVRHHVNGHFALRGNLMFSTVRGSDANSSADWQRQRNLSFKSPLHELSATLEYYPLKFEPAFEQFDWSPFLSIGLAGFYFNPKAELNGNEFELQPLGTEGQGLPGYADKYSRVASSLLVGGGLAMKFNDRLTIHGELISRRASTDYIDDVSKEYVNYYELLNSPTNGPLAAALADRTGEYLGMTEVFTRDTGEQRGGETVRDYYFSFMVSFSILLNDAGSSNNGYRGRRSGRGKSKIKCPEF